MLFVAHGEVVDVVARFEFPGTSDIVLFVVLDAVFGVVAAETKTEQRQFVYKESNDCRLISIDSIQAYKFFV